LTIYFGFDKWRLRPGDLRYIKGFSDALARNAKVGTVELSVEGYADSRGKDPYNCGLAGRRAMCAKLLLEEYLRKPHGSTVFKIEILDYGKTFQFCADKTDECYRRNRRVRITRKELADRSIKSCSPSMTENLSEATCRALRNSE
jgi:peptidoglycan-associated lipoprotein